MTLDLPNETPLSERLAHLHSTSEELTRRGAAMNGVGYLSALDKLVATSNPSDAHYAQLVALRDDFSRGIAADDEWYTLLNAAGLTIVYNKFFPGLLRGGNN